jgi:hypothetical protein
MSSQQLEMGEGFHLAPIRASDKAAYLEHFADPEIGRMLLAVPVPYTEADADRWIAHRLKNALKHEIQFGIRVANGSLMVESAWWRNDRPLSIAGRSATGWLANTAGGD